MLTLSNIVIDRIRESKSNKIRRYILGVSIMQLVIYRRLLIPLLKSIDNKIVPK
jgi:hypothetical protein